jgi:CRP-like cAMP-binding protein
LYIVHAGQVRVIEKPFFWWPAKTIATLGPGEIFGEMALIDQPYRTATVVTEGPAQLFVLLISEFNRILNDNPDFVRQMQKIAHKRAFETKNS